MRIDNHSSNLKVIGGRAVIPGINYFQDEDGLFSLDNFLQNMEKSYDALELNHHDIHGVHYYGFSGLPITTLSGVYYEKTDVRRVFRLKFGTLWWNGKMFSEGYNFDFTGEGNILALEPGPLVEDAVVYPVEWERNIHDPYKGGDVDETYRIAYQELGFDGDMDEYLQNDDEDEDDEEEDETPAPSTEKPEWDPEKDFWKDVNVFRNDDEFQHPGTGKIDIYSFYVENLDPEDKRRVFVCPSESIGNPEFFNERQFEVGFVVEMVDKSSPFGYILHEMESYANYEFHANATGFFPGDENKEKREELKANVLRKENEWVTFKRFFDGENKDRLMDRDFDNLMDSTNEALRSLMQRIDPRARS